MKNDSAGKNTGAETKDIVIALAGNPNSGKTTVFNNLTGARQHVGNWPGVTVEKKEARLTRNGRNLRIVDLPGTYSLTAFSMEEIIARNYIVTEQPDVVINVVDASNLERNLYLTTQLMELGANVIVLLNMMDESEASGQKINIELLSKLLGAPVVPAVARLNKGPEQALEAAVEMTFCGAVCTGCGACGAAAGSKRQVRVTYGWEIEEEIEKIEAVLKAGGANSTGRNIRWTAVKLLENDVEERRTVGAMTNGKEIIDEAEKSRAHLASIYRDDVQNIITDQRYGFITGLIKETVFRPSVSKQTVTDKIDSVLLNRVLGLPVFLLIMLGMFLFVFAVGDYPTRLLGQFFAWLGGLVEAHSGGTIIGSLISDGLIGGVGGILAFVPNIMLLFLCIAVLEDSGYMSRAAFIMDRVMHVMGLHGKSFIPMLIGMGCNVPAIMATRMLENRKDRMVTMLIVPLVSCGARLPVYALLAGAFFPWRIWGAISAAGLAVFAVYVVGVLLAAAMARLLRWTVFRGPEAPFVMELPPYRKPALKSIIVHTWERTWMYIRKAGTIVLALTALIWFAMTFPVYPGSAKYEKMMPAAVESGDAKRVASLHSELAENKLEYSIAGRMAIAISPVMKPIGFDPRVTVALISGLAAKEVIVTTLGTSYSIEETGGDSPSLRDAVKNDPKFNPLTAAAIMLFTLTSIPCAATLAAIKKETDSWRWPAFSAAYQLILAWGLCFLLYNAGRALGF